MSTRDAATLWILEAAGIELVARFASRGVDHVKWFSAFPENPDAPGVAAWLCTATDADRDALRLEFDLQDALDEVLKNAGLPASDVAASFCVVESQATVERVSGGNWLRAMRFADAALA